MYQHPDESTYYREYASTSNEIHYADPDYYHNEIPQVSRPAQSLDLHAGNAGYDDYQAASTLSPYDAAQMHEYRGPSSMEGYTVDAGSAQRDAAQRGTAEGNKQRKKGLAGIGGLLVALGAWLLKLKFLLVVFKFGLAGFSALISIAVYSFLFGWPFAVGLVALLFIHEMGHAIVMKLKGIPVGGMIFIPMLGAAVTMRQMPQNARDEAEVGIAGPIAGAIASSVCLFLSYSVGAGTSHLWASLAYFGFFMNLFNLIPIVPFDGGRVLAAIDKRVWILGFVALLGLQVWQWLNHNFSIWLLLFVIIAATQLWSRGFSPKDASAQAYYNVPVVTRIFLALLYFGLAAVLVVGMAMSHGMLPVMQGQ